MNEEMFSNYQQMSDEKLIENIEANDQNALNCLIKRYNEVVYMKANKFFMVGAEKEDMIQEGMIGLYKAVKSYNLDKQNSFKTFANMCIERQLITAVKNSNRQKHIPLNSSVSLNASAYEEDDNSVSVMEILETKSVEDPSDIIANKEYYKYIETKINESLSDFEKQVLEQYKKGQTYVDIATKLNSKVKSVDTAIQRIRKKATKIKSELG
ncbi:MAG: RNA polymerase sporulation sigma factor SigH [Clostridia bacterium]|nr:RNA polymerase sporulation sigma factor SigH [Clostridia bacterium]